MATPLTNLDPGRWADREAFLAWLHAGGSRRLDPQVAMRVAAELPGRRFTPDGPPGWVPLDTSSEPGRWWRTHHLAWQPVEERLFAEFRRRSDEAFVLSFDLCRLAEVWFGVDPGRSQLLDLGASEGGMLSSQLRGRFGGYQPVPFDGRWAHDSGALPDLDAAVQVVAAVHVVQYMARPDLLLAGLADRAVEAVAVVVLLDLAGDQYEAWEHARAVQPGFPARFDHVTGFRDWLAACRVPFQEAQVWTATQVPGEASLRDTLAFFLATEDEALVHRVAERFRGQRRLSTAHRVFGWRLADLAAAARGR